MVSNSWTLQISPLNVINPISELKKLRFRKVRVKNAAPSHTANKLGPHLSMAM
jgi:hypothetical protein